MKALRYAVVDTETTGTLKEDRAVSLAIVVVEDGVVRDTYYRVVNPERAISAEAMAIHHITEDDVKDAPTLVSLLPELIERTAGCVAYVAHNAPFDRRMLPGLPEKPWLDTLPLARVLHPSLESYRNEALKETLALDCSTFEGVAHNALYDAQVTTRLFLHLMALLPEKHSHLTTVPQLEEFITQEKNKPRLLTICFLPKHKDTRWEDVPTDYLQWLVDKYRGNESVLLTARHHLQRRAQSQVSDSSATASTGSQSTVDTSNQSGWQTGASRRF